MRAKAFVSKRLGTPYRSGRVNHWLKIKNPAAPAVRRLEAKDRNQPDRHSLLFCHHARRMKRGGKSRRAGANGPSGRCVGQHCQATPVCQQMTFVVAQIIHARLPAMRNRRGDTGRAPILWPVLPRSCVGELNHNHQQPHGGRRSPRSGPTSRVGRTKKSSRNRKDGSRTFALSEPVHSKTCKCCQPLSPIYDCSRNIATLCYRLRDVGNKLKLKLCR